MPMAGSWKEMVFKAPYKPKDFISSFLLPANAYQLYHKKFVVEGTLKIMV